MQAPLKKCTAFPSEQLSNCRKVRTTFHPGVQDWTPVGLGTVSAAQPEGPRLERQSAWAKRHWLSDPFFPVESKVIWPLVLYHFSFSSAPLTLTVCSQYAQHPTKGLLSLPKFPFSLTWFVCYLQWPLPGTSAYLWDPLGFKVAGGGREGGRY